MAACQLSAFDFSTMPTIDESARLSTLIGDIYDAALHPDGEKDVLGLWIEQ